MKPEEISPAQPITGVPPATTGALPPMAGWLERLEEEPETTIIPPPPSPLARRKIVFFLLTGLLLGTIIGSLATRQHYKGAQVVASVNGVLITEPEFVHRMEMTTGDTTLRQMVTEELQLQYARKAGVLPTEAAVRARYKQVSEDPAFGQYLAATRQSPEDVMQSLRVSMAQDALLTRGATVSEADVQAYYARQTDAQNPHARFYTPPSVTIAVITTHSRQQADLAAAELAKGTAFSQIAARYSTDSSKLRGGLLPPVLWGRTPSRHVSGAQETIFAMQVGEQRGPVQLAGLWWIIRCLDKKNAVVKPFASVQAQCRDSALLEKGLPANGRAEHASYQQFVKAAAVRAFWAQYKATINTR